MNDLKHFMFGNGYWWKFWNPNSGFMGGTIAMLIILIILQIWLKF